MGGDGREIAIGSTWNEALGLRGARESNCQVGFLGKQQYLLHHQGNKFNCHVQNQAAVSASIDHEC